MMRILHSEISALKAKYAGQMDMAKAGAIVKSLLGG